MDETSGEAALTTMGDARNRSPSAADHLANAWREAYGRAPDPSKAYAEAVRAVEAASIPIVSPNNLKATLGTIRGELRGAPNRWQLSIPGPNGNGDVDPLIQMISLLWEGQSDCHGATPTRPVTEAAAEMAVHLAVTLVQWFSTGKVSTR